MRKTYVIIAFGGIRLLRHFTNARLEVATTIEGDLKNITNHKEEHGDMVSTCDLFGIGLLITMTLVSK
ncbi:hypothetical protein [Peribacillus simplex]|uniref:hypothetical protein n=1 Tax=Peribacillus simplex TaxID=1478 RepID=UPI0011A4CF86|nr:hypothetical protein [Peribacillus simplex]